MAINYRNEPFQIRTAPGKPGLAADPAYVYSSAVHGDPSTPVFEAYPGDPVVFRHMTGAHEEVHTFNLHGHRWLSQPDNPLSNPVDTQTAALGEYFNYEVSGASVVHKTLTGKDELRRARGNGHGHSGDDGTPDIPQGGAG